MKQPIENLLTEALDEQEHHLDAATLSRLNQARQRALESHTGIWTRWRRNIIAGAGIAATAVTLFMPVHLSLHTEQAPVAPDYLQAEQVEAMQIISLDVDLELVEELEFYRWLDQQQTQEGA